MTDNQLIADGAIAVIGSAEQTAENSGASGDQNHIEKQGIIQIVLLRRVTDFVDILHDSFKYADDGHRKHTEPECPVFFQTAKIGRQ